MEAGFLARNEQDHCVQETTGLVLEFSGDKSRKERPIEIGSTPLGLGEWMKRFCTVLSEILDETF